MKLEIEYPAAPSSQSVKFHFTAAADDSTADAAEILEAGIRYAKEGKREQARHLLLRAAALEPANEAAWLWLASLSDYPEELLIFLQNVLDVNPANERAVEWQQATRALLAKTFVERGIAAAEENRKDYAARCFMQALLHDNRNEAAWLRLAQGAETPEEKAAHLEKLLEINPENETALASLNSLRHQISQSLLRKANFAAISGERDEARRLLREAMRDAPELEEAWILKAYLADANEEKIGCYEKILEINPENEAAQAGLASLRALMQKTAEKKSNAESLLRAFAAINTEELSPAAAPAAPLGTPEEAPDPADPAEVAFEVIGQPGDEAPAAAADAAAAVTEAEIKEVSPQEFDFEDQNAELPPAKPFEIPTDDLDVRFVEEIRAQGAFADEPPLAWESFQQHSKDEELEAAERFLQQLEAERQNEDLLSIATFGGEVGAQSRANSVEELQLPAVEALDDAATDGELPPFEVPAAAEAAVAPENQARAEEEEEGAPAAGVSHDFSKTSEIPASFETTHLDQSFLNQANASSEDFVSRWETFSQASAAAAEAAASEESRLPAAIPAPAVEDFGSESGGHLLPPRDPVAKEGAPPRPHSQTEFQACPFCYVTNEPQSFICASCHSMVSLSDMEMILSHSGANPEVISMAIEDLEGEKAARPLSESELTHLGIAHLNAKNLRQALACLQEASHLAPNNIVLAGKVNFLAIRLAELEAQESRHEAEPQLRNLTIMVVDDSPTVRKLISGKLEKCGHTVVAAENGPEALEKIKERVPDLILLDIMMPQMDGYQVCKLIRSYDPTKNVPVVMISGKDGFFDKARARMAGTSGYITKPFGPDTLMKTIETYVA